MVTPRPVRAGVLRSVSDEHFRIEHLVPTLGAPVEVPATPPHTLNAISGTVSIRRTSGELAGRLARGESALVPAGVGAYRVEADEEPVLLIKTELPPYAD
jgi:mannose-6-phosphate isomerase class I